METKIIFVIGILLVSISAFASNCILSNGINIQTSKRLLFICEQDRVIKKFKIALGSNGVGKTHEGDNKTPLGLYELTTPRLSKRFGIFIPIQYPTPEQVAAGYTGKDVGIHGPIQLASWTEFISTRINWTEGCIAVGNNEYIVYIAEWVDQHPEAKVLII